MRHRASELGSAFDPSLYGGEFDADGYGGGFDLESAAVTRGGFEPVAASAPAPAVRRRGRPVAVAGMAAVALVGVAVLVAGATQVVRRDQLTGSALPLPGPHAVAVHQAPAPAGVVARHHPPVARGSVTGPTSHVAPPAPTTSARPVQGTQLPNTIRLPRGGTAYLVHVRVANDGTLPIPSGVDQAVWWGTGLNAAAGATVFAGHVNWAGVTGPFAELWQDRLGAVITIRDNSGKQLRYRVTKVLTLNKSTLPKQAPTLFSASGPQRIVVATCGGEWVGGALGYADNRVMVATPVK
ncbi:MAG TPA: class F sortase [Pseudonocardiaceae bacterium]|nr:class F sortase [Pseudonocardiaceae bacterium]